MGCISSSPYHDGAHKKDRNEKKLPTSHSSPPSEATRNATLSKNRSAASPIFSNPVEKIEDERSRKLDVPLAKVVKRAEDEVLTKGNENNGFLSFSNGFLPMLYPELGLPSQFKAWDELGKNMGQMMSDLTLRPYIENELILLPASDLDDRYLFRAALVLGMASHGYWYCGPKTPTSLPRVLKEPWELICTRLGRKGAYLSGEDVQLYNFAYKHGNNERGPFDSQHPDFLIENLDMLQSMWGNKAEIIFHLAFCEMAKAAAPLLGLICHAQDAVQRDDPALMLKTLQSIAKVVEAIEAAFMKIIPDPTANLGLDPLVWAKTVAPVGISFNKGMPSPSGLGTPFFHCLDVFFARGQYSSILGRDSVHARDFFPINWTNALGAIAECSVHVYIASSDDEELHTAWSNCIDSYASWNGMLGKHLQKTYGFLELAFKTGREKTLGGFEGGFRDRMWDKVMDMLDTARKERLRAKNAALRLPVAKASNMEGEGGMVTLTYTLPHSAFDWKPGDTVSVWPSNSDETVEGILNAMGASGDESIIVTDEWRTHMKHFVDLGMKRSKKPSSAKLRDVLRYAQLNPIPPETRQYLASFFPTSKIVQMCIDGTTQFNLEEIMGYIRLRGGDDIFEVQDGGRLLNMKLPDCKALFAELDAEGGEGPLVEDVVSIIRSMGITEVPLFAQRRVSAEDFEMLFYPLFSQLHRDEQSSAHVIDLLQPISSRQYSIASLRDEKDEELSMKLVVSRLSYSKPEIAVGPRPNWRTSERSAQLAMKYFRRWKAIVEGKSTSVARYSSMLIAHKLLSTFGKAIPVRGVASNFLCDGGDLLFKICSNPMFRPPATSEPLLMVAAGSGISPFLGYLEERCASKSSAPTIILWSVPYARECAHMLPDLERMVQDRAEIQIIIAISRESRWPILRGGKFHMESRPQGRITDLMERNIQLRRDLRELLLPKKYGCSGGYGYLCGSASFVQSTLNVLSDVLMDVDLFDNESDYYKFMCDAYGKPSDWLFKCLKSDKRILFEVFNDKAAANPPTLGISDLVMKNDPDSCIEGLWMAVYGEVYNVKSFDHPGGESILHSYCGMDASKAWEGVRHHRSQSLNAKLATLHVGKLAAPNFLPLPLMKLSDETLTDVNGVFASWRNLLFDVVEIENAVRLEYTLVNLHVAGNSTSEVLTPMKQQMIFQAHRRFVFSHIASIVSVRLEDARRYARALRHPQNLPADEQSAFQPDNETSFNKLRQELVDSEFTSVTLRACDALVAACHFDDPDDSLMKYLCACTRSMRIFDLKLIHNWKKSLRRVMLYFEKRDGQPLSLFQLYHELHNASLAMMDDLKAYVTQVSAPAIIDPLWKYSPGERSAACDGKDWLFPKEAPRKSMKEGWQAASSRKEKEEEENPSSSLLNEETPRQAKEQEHQQEAMKKKEEETRQAKEQEQQEAMKKKEEETRQAEEQEAMKKKEEEETRQAKEPERQEQATKKEEEETREEGGMLLNFLLGMKVNGGRS